MSAVNAPFFVDREVIVVKRSGVWLADGVEITHEPTRKLFARSLRRDAEGYFLAIGRETKRIEVEDTPFFVLRVDGSSSEGFTALLSNGQELVLALEAITYRPGRLAFRWVPPAFTSEEDALFLHAPYFDLLSHLIEDERGYWLEAKGKRQLLQSRVESDPFDAPQGSSA
jgi:hypothetical protein